MYAMQTRGVSSWSVLLLFLCSNVLLAGCEAKKSSRDLSADNPTQEAIIGDLDWSDVSSLPADNPRRENARYVGYLYRAVDSGYLRCTASLVAPTLVITNRHCVDGPLDAPGTRVNFNYLNASDYDSESVLADEGFVCEEYVAGAQSHDVSLLRCREVDNNNQVVSEVLGGYLNVLHGQTDPVINDGVYLLHQNCDYSGGGSCDFTSNEATKKMSPGIVQAIPTNNYNLTSGWSILGSDALEHTCDSLGGSSGALLFQDTSHLPIALHHAGSATANDAILLSAIFQDISGLRTAIEQDIQAHSSSVTCGDGVIEGDEQCEGTNFGGATCQGYGWDAGDLTCTSSCLIDTSGCTGTQPTCFIQSSPGSGFTMDFTPQTDCTCDQANPDCHILYRGRVDGLNGNVATLSFEKANGGGTPSADIHYWVVVGEAAPQCTLLSDYSTADRAQGTWTTSEAVLQVPNVNVWPTQADFDTAAPGTTKHLFLITGAGTDPNSPIYFQETAITFTKICQ